jgi:hypothetical protein
MRVLAKMLKGLAGIGLILPPALTAVFACRFALLKVQLSQRSDQIYRKPLLEIIFEFIASCLGAFLQAILF